MTTFAATAGFPHPALVGVTDPEGVLAVQGDADKVLQLASVSKPLTAWGVMVAIDRGLVSLTDAAGPAGSTVHNLLDHTSGLPFDGTEPLGAAPGNRRIYSNTGFEVLGEHVAQAVGMSFSDWMRQEITGPLGMTSTQVDGHPGAAYRSTINDLLIFGREVLWPRLISPALAEDALTVSRPGLRGLVPGYGTYDDCQWGLGFELKAQKVPHWLGDAFPPETAGHFGAAGSFLFIDRSRDIAGAFLSGTLFNAEHKRMWPGLTNEIAERYGE